MRIGVNCGHTLSGAGSGAVGYLTESQETRLVGKALMRMLQDAGVEVVDCTIDSANTQEEYLSAAVALANREDLDWFISIHFNAAKNADAEGCEVYTYKGRQYQDALDVCQNIAALGFRNRGVKDGSGLYVVRKTKAKSMLIEVCFVTNEADSANYKICGEEAIAQAVFSALYDNGAVPVIGTPIKGESILTPEEIISWMQSKRDKYPEMKNYEYLPYIFVNEGAAEGVRGDLAFCQSIIETNYFKFGGDVISDQHNYAGLGTVGGGVRGCYFENDTIGIRAQIQHLKAYGSQEPLKGACVDPRYNLVTPHGKAKTIEELAGKWAVPGYNTDKYDSLQAANDANDSYGYRILNVYQDIVLYNQMQDGKNENGAGRVYMKIIGFCKTEEELREFDEMTKKAGINGQLWFGNPGERLE